VALVWSREVESWSAALREELRIKSLPRNRKEALLDPHGESRPSEL
jgi:predicted GIY-YIG superfamily endonuclease